MPEASHAAAPRPRVHWTWWALAALALLALAHVHAWRFLGDDAYISFRYADNLARYGQLAFNPPGLDPRPVEGYTNLLWVLLLAAGRALGIAPPHLAPLLTGAGAGAALLLATTLTARLVPPAGPSPASAGWLRRGLPPAALLAPLLLATWPEFVVWGSGGLEGALAVALVLAAAWAWERQAAMLAAGFAAAAALTRPDALVPIAGYGVGWLIVLRARPECRLPTWRRLGLALACFALPLALHLLWRRATYGAFLPNTWAIKSHGVDLAAAWGLPYVRAWARGVGLLGLAPLALGLRARAVPPLLSALASAAYVARVGGDFMAYGRLLLPATVMVAVTSGAAWGVLARALRRRLSPRKNVTVAAVAALACLLLSGAHAWSRHEQDMARTEGWLDGRWEGVRTMDRFARVRVAAGVRLRARVPADTRIVVGAAGALPWASRLPAWDSFGLVTPKVAEAGHVLPAGRARPGHQVQATVRQIRALDPDLLCHVGYPGPRRPPESAARAPYRRGYRWACVELGEVPDPRAPGGAFDGGFYCCRRPSGRLREAFGGAP